MHTIVFLYKSISIDISPQKKSIFIYNLGSSLNRCKGYEENNTNPIIYLHINNIYIYIYGWVHITSSITLKNVTSPNNLLLNSYFENSIVELHVQYVLNIHANFHINQM